MFEITGRDAAGRTGLWTVGAHKITTPQIAVVVNPNKFTVPPPELKKEFGAELIITNTYIIKRSSRFSEILSGGIHKAYGWDGPVYTDSGTYQMHSQGSANIRPGETIDMQQKMGSDIITPLDLFTEPGASRDIASRNVKETQSRVNMARELVNGRQLVGPIQGGLYLDLRKEASEGVASENPDVFAIGGIVPLMEQYRYRELAQIIIQCKKSLPGSAPVHAFGAGHPMVFSLLAACGVDLFDSAAYALYAEAGRYMTPQGTLKAEEITHFPCECPVCSSHTPRELDVNLLARHNLYVTFAEIRAIRQAIHDGRLWDFLRIRALAHPALFSAYEYVLSEYSFFASRDPVTKGSPFFYFGRESLERPDIKRSILSAGKIKSGKKFRWYGRKIPCGVCGVYPFSNSMPECGQNKVFSGTKPRVILQSVLEYQYGKKAAKILGRGTRIEVSKKTGRVRRVFIEGKLAGTIRARDGFFVPTLFGAERLIGVIGDDFSVRVLQEVVPYICGGNSVFSKFVVSCGKYVIPGAEVFVTCGDRKVIACGTAKLNAKEMREFKRGVAVDVRHSSDL